MAASKDVFEPATFAANAFAAGAFRGLGVTLNIIAGPYRWTAIDAHLPGAAAIASHLPGTTKADCHLPGAAATAGL